MSLTPDIERVLAEHRLHASLNICYGSDDRFPPRCKWKPAPDAGPLSDQHRAHQAEQIAALLGQHVEAAKRDHLTAFLAELPDDVFSENTQRLVREWADEWRAG